MDGPFSGINGSLTTNPEDLVNFTHALHSGELLQPATLNEMHVNYSPNEDFQYGLGVGLYNDLNYDNWGGSGYYGYRSIVGYFPDLNITIAVQQNDHRRNGAGVSFDGYDLFLRLLEAYLDYSPTAITDANEDPVGIQVFPNPASDHLIIDLSNYVLLTAPAEATLFHMNGQIIRSFILQEDKTRLDISDLSTGSYVLKVLGEQVKVVIR